MGPIFYLLRFLFSRSFSARSTSDFGTLTNFRARASNARKPFGFFGLVLSLLTFATPLLGDSHKAGIVNRCQHAVGKALADDLPERLKESVEIAHKSVVEPESLFMGIPENVPGCQGDIGSLDAAFEEGPKILHAIDVRRPIFVLLLAMVHRSVNMGKAEFAVGWRFVSVDRRAGLDVRAYWTSPAKTVTVVLPTPATATW
jgi:hypothetical protein